MSARYDPATLQILDAATAYEEFHEFAHMEQDMRQTIAWRWRKTFRDSGIFRATGFGGMAELWCEIEAVFLARGEMLRCHLWGRTERREALRGLSSHAWHIFFDW